VFSTQEGDKYRPELSPHFHNILICKAQFSAAPVNVLLGFQIFAFGQDMELQLDAHIARGASP
jgi:hypothetical protein